MHCPGQAQQETKKDSLLRLLQEAKDDTAKVLLYIDIGNEYELDDLQNAGKYYSLAGDLSKRLQYKRGIIKFISNYTGILNLRGAFDSSLMLNRQAISLAHEINDNIINGKAWANTGNVFFYLNEYDSAVYYYETAKRYFEETKNAQLTARIYDLLQNVYLNLKQPAKALQLGKASLYVLRTSTDSLVLAQVLINLGNNYQTLNFRDSALNCYNEALQIAGEINYKQAEMVSTNNIGNIYWHKFDTAKMKPYFEKALSLSREMEEPDYESSALRGLALYHLLRKQYDSAKKHVEDAIVINNKYDLQKEKSENLSLMSSILFAMQDIIGAEVYLDSSTSIQNKLTGDEIQKSTLIIEKKFETEKKGNLIKLQESQLREKNYLIYALTAGVAALIIISILIYRNHKNKQEIQQAKIDELETEKQLTATEAVLKGEEQERTRLAKDLHDGLGGMLSGIKLSLNNMKGNLIMTPDNAQAFERSMDMLDSSIKEMRRVAHNMMPEVLVKYGLDTALKEFCNDIGRSGVLQVNYQSFGMDQATIELTVTVTIYRIVQELVNNVIKHAAARNILVQLHFSQPDKQLSITIEDDGKGFDPAILKQSTGLGWRSIQNRVEFLKGKLDVNSSIDKGTSVLIEITAS